MLSRLRAELATMLLDNITLEAVADSLISPMGPVKGAQGGQHVTGKEVHKVYPTFTLEQVWASYCLNLFQSDCLMDLVHFLGQHVIAPLSTFNSDPWGTTSHLATASRVMSLSNLMANCLLSMIAVDSSRCK
jgi:hypothetical protein